MKELFKTAIADSKLELAEGARKELYRGRWGGLTAVDLASHMKTVGDLLDWLDCVAKYLIAEYDVLRLELLPTAMEKEKLESPLNVAGVGRVSLTGDMYVAVLNKEELFDWLIANGSEDLITEVVNASTLKASLKGRILGAKSLPPSEVVKVTPFTRASITKAK